jgi:beta-phosphoglucomutase
MLERADISAVIFDMDGLVLDTEKTFRAAWREAGQSMGVDLPDDFLERLCGLAGDTVLRHIESFSGPGFDSSEFLRLTAVCWRNYVGTHGIEVKAGFHMLRDYLKREGIPFCLATNSAWVNAETCLELAGLSGVFPIVIARDHAPRPKPAPDIFLWAAFALRVPAERCLVLEDSPAGIEAAFEAAALPVMVPSMRPVDAATRARCRLVLNTLAELPGILG